MRALFVYYLPRGQYIRYAKRAIVFLFVKRALLRGQESFLAAKRVCVYKDPTDDEALSVGYNPRHTCTCRNKTIIKKLR